MMTTCVCYYNEGPCEVCGPPEEETTMKNPRPTKTWKDIAVRTIAGAVIVAGTTTATTFGATSANAHTDHVEGSFATWLATTPYRPHKPCKYEDSNWCVWDARHMGNGIGDSFWVTRIGHVHYVSHWRAHHMLASNA
jgi:hypothetical protein